MKKPTKTTIKTKLLNFLDRRKHTAEENLRLAGLAGIILISIGLFLPLIGVNTSLGFVNGANSSEETSLIKPDNAAFQASSSDFIFHQPLQKFELYGTDIGDMEILGINLYSLITTPFPDFSALNDVSSFLNSGMLDFLTDENFVKFCNDNLGDLGASLVAIGKTVSEVANQAGPVLDGVINILSNLNKASEGIRDAIAVVEGYLNLVDNIFIILFILILAAIIWFMVGRGPRYLPAVFLTIFSVLFVAIGIGVLVGNNIIADALQSAMQSLSTAIYTLIDGIVPGGTSILNGLFQIDQMQFVVHIDLFCGAGWWLITIGLVGVTILSYITPKLRKKAADQLKAEKQSKAIAKEVSKAVDAKMKTLEKAKN